MRIEGKDGKAVSIVCDRMKLGEFDRSGRKKPVAIPGSQFTLEVNAVISAISQVPDLSFVPKDSGVSVNKWSAFDLAKGSLSRTTSETVYAGGDAVTGPATVIEAIAAGHQAARDIDVAIRSANGEPAYIEPEEEKIDVPLIIDEETFEAPQCCMPELHGPDRKTGFAEVELGLPRKTPSRRRSVVCGVTRKSRMTRKLTRYS